MLKIGDEVEHMYYGKCILIQAPDELGECVVYFDKAIPFEVSELVTHEKLLKKIK